MANELETTAQALVAERKGILAADESFPTIEVTLEFASDYFGPGTLLTAGAGTGIVAADDGGAWAGVAGLELPFP